MGPLHRATESPAAFAQKQRSNQRANQQAALGWEPVSEYSLSTGHSARAQPRALWPVRCGR